jgi:uncharacterized Fe-S cluster-containing MiaB family protein
MIHKANQSTVSSKKTKAVATVYVGVARDEINSVMAVTLTYVLRISGCALLRFSGMLRSVCWYLFTDVLDP